MNEHDPIIESLQQIGTSLREQRTMKAAVLAQIKAGEAAGRPRQERPWYLRRMLGAVGGIAACIAMAVIVWTIGGGFDAQKAFAGALDRVKFARTFSCLQVYESTQDGQTQIKHSTRFMFKEPDRERYEKLATPTLGDEITIDDYAVRRRLDLQPASKTASLEDTSTMYSVDSTTGRLQPTRLNTDLRDRIFKWSSRNAEDLGIVSLEGRSVRLLRSKKDDAIIQVWLDPQTRLPIQITLESPEHGWRWLYTSIRIDESLDDSLFSLQPPADYKLFRGAVYSPWSDHLGQLYAKMRFLSHKSYEYASEHNDQFSKDLSDLRSVGITDEILKTVMAPEGQPDAPPIIVYRQPRPEHDTAKEIMFYEAFDQWPSGGIPVFMADGHGEVIAQQSRFDEWMR